MRLTDHRIKIAVFWAMLLWTAAPAAAEMDENTAKAVRLNDAATAKLSAGNLDGAEIDLLQALEYSGNNASVRKNLGVVYFEKGTRALKVKKDYFEAQRYFRDALRIEPTSAVYKRGLASALFLEAGQRSRQGQSELALTLYEKAAAADPQNSAVWAAASQQAWQMQKLDKAADYLQKAKTLKPSDKNVQVLEQRLRTPAAEKNYETRQSEHFVLSADEGFMDKVGSHEILYDLEQQYNQVSYKLSYYPKQKIPVVLYTTADFHKSWSLPARVSGYYDGKLRIPYSPAHPSLEPAAASVRHELTHAFIRSINPGPVPTWIGEGLAQWVEGRRLEPKAADSLIMYHVTRRLPPLGSLDRAFEEQKNPYNSQQMTAAYMKSFSVTDYLIETYGIWTVLEVVRMFSPSAPNSADMIFKKSFGADLKTIDERWIKWLDQKQKVR